jgi:hypothetical protein
VPELAKSFRRLRQCRADDQYEGSDGRSHHNADLKTRSFHNIFSSPLQVPIKKFQEICVPTRKMDQCSAILIVEKRLATAAVALQRMT